ncbi:MAG: hypothetical protein FWF70_07695 [Bacteroidetes bacterium]|nr:hypothetical protein [Bacteroidota bacterium]MCL1968109.1 hypothetical protein [Bacteroidota bacterium]
MKKIILLLILFLSTVTTAFSQEFFLPNSNYVDTATFMVWASPKFAVHFPFDSGYLSSTFGYNYVAGLDITIKTKSNWTISLTFDYMFGSKLKKSPKDILGGMYFLQQKISGNDTTYIPVIFNSVGNNNVVLGYEGRYWSFGTTVGKIFSVDRWKNSGLWLKLGASYFGHKIHFTDPNHFFPQIDQNYGKGYDQRSSGIALNQFFGYLFLQRRRVLSFYIGIEVWEIFSKPDRGYIFAGDLKGTTDKLPRLFSGLVGVKLGWNLPFYEKKRITTLYTY